MRKYLDDHDLTQRALAHKMNRSEPTVSLWLSGENVPDLPGGVRLDEITDGAVPVWTWTQKPRRNRKARRNGKAA